MSWELVSFLILGAVLLGGFAWYERSRPPAQVVALVAALAALAIVGRIAFAAFPNVKPTTDIVIFAGYALGGAPGFAVGALAALVSNFWFGQGPWTPWQMAGWGLCGLLGAALALGGRNVGRLGLAATCGLAGILYGALLNFSLMATYGGELSLERFGVLSARAIPFDAAHVVGNVVLALVAGPALVRMLARFRQRFEWQRGGGEGGPPPQPPEPPDRQPPRRLGPALKGGGIAALVVASVLLAMLAPGRAEAAGADSAVQWLGSIQNNDGGWGASPDDDSGPEMTAWVMLGLEAAGHNPYDLTRGSHSPITFLRGHVDELESPGDLARTTLALLGAGADPREFGGHNLVASLRNLRLDNGSYKNWPNSTAFAVIALRAADAPGGTDKSLEWLRKVQNDDGGWGNEPGQRSDAEATSSVLQALTPGSKPAKDGLDYLRDAQQSNGGYRVGGNGAINTQATAWAIQGILAAGGDLGSFKRGGSTALDYIASNQSGNGHYRYSKSSDQTPVWVTGQALVAVSKAYYPIAAPAREQSATETSSTSAGSGGAAPSLGGSAPIPPFESEAAPGAPGASGGSGSGSGSKGSAPPGSKAPGGANGGPPVGQAGGLTNPELPPSSESEATPAAAEEPTSDADNNGTAGAIVLGLLAGCLIFGAALLGRKGWMHWRYGL
ncbi:MAG TPA: prenyltransferase/squalene oxidase repeat-containing protein [Solirubrobacterales bacterium]|nr:prenyltransferase/squalene oxidase repeat-containing protein [Solirubrobacterales bacterium]